MFPRHTINACVNDVLSHAFENYCLSATDKFKTHSKMVVIACVKAIPIGRDVKPYVFFIINFKTWLGIEIEKKNKNKNIKKHKNKNKNKKTKKQKNGRVC